MGHQRLIFEFKESIIEKKAGYSDSPVFLDRMDADFYALNFYLHMRKNY
jgi:hypothetical protein